MISMGEVVAIVAMLGTILSALGVVWRVTWRAAVTTTSVDLRLASLESSRTMTEARHSKLEEAIDELTKAIYRLRADIRVNEARASQGGFDNSDTDPPRRG